GVLRDDPRPHGTQEVAEVNLAGGLDAGEHAGHGRIVEVGPGETGTGNATRRDDAPGNHRRVIIIVPMPYAVQTPVFEGPFDLLLHLILSEQVDLYEISLSTIVDGYIAELERMEQLNPEMASQFLLIAAALVERTCRMLLPHR